MTGWNTAEVTRKEVPDQKASIADPLSFTVMMGNAILRDVASSAAASVMMQMEANASMNPFTGLKGAWKSSNGGITEASLAPDTLLLSTGDSGLGDGFSSIDREVADIVKTRGRNLTTLSTVLNHEKYAFTKDTEMLIKMKAPSWVL